MSGFPEWSVVIRDANCIEQESADGYKRIRLEILDNDMGTFTLELPASHPAVDWAVQPGAGIVVRRHGTNRVEFSGYALDVYYAESQQSPKGDVTIVGVCDNILLAKELAYVNTAQDVSTSGLTTYAAEFATYTGPGETAIKNIIGNNIGPAADIVRRRYAHLNIPATTGLGTSGTWKARFEPILDRVQDMAKYSGLSFRLVQGIPGKIDVEVWDPAVVAEARFSVEARNIKSIVGTFRAPDTTEVVVGGGGEGRARVWTRRSSGLSTAYGRRATIFHSRMDTVDLAEMRQTADEDLAEGTATSGITFEVADTPSLKYGVHYSVGDIVTAVVRGVEVSDTIKRVEIIHEPGRAPQITPSIGLPNEPESDGLVKTMRQILKRLGADERR
jgi:hypothetical protein